MRAILFPLLLGCGAASATAQTPCFDLDYGMPIGGGNDVVLPLEPIGFAFPFAGTTYADFYASTNGFVYLRNGAASTPPSPLCCAGTPAALLANAMGPMLCPLWTDLDLNAENTGQVFVRRSASTCTITWHNAVAVGDPGNTRCHPQLQIHASGEIAFAYTEGTGAHLFQDCLVGVSPGNGASDPGTSMLSAGGTSAGSTLYQTFAAGSPAFDLAGHAVTLAPVNPQAPNSPIAWSSAACPGAGAPADAAAYGRGCNGQFNSLYEFFAYPGTFDLDGKSWFMAFASNGYLVFAGGSASLTPPSPAATVLPLGDDTEVDVTLSTPFPFDGGTTSTLTVCDNGFVSVGQGNGTSPTPTAHDLLDLPRTVFASWHDYDVTAPGSGQVKFEEVGGIAYITWDGVYSRGTTSPDTFQFQFRLANGSFSLVWGNSGGLGNPRLVGFSVGGPSLDPGGSDFSSLSGFSTIFFGAERAPMQLFASGFASPGATVVLSTTGIPANTMVGAIGLGLTKYDPGLLTIVNGMPSMCLRYNEHVAVTLFHPPQSGGTFTAPTGAAFLGVIVLAQTGVLTSTAPYYWSSNGIEIRLGT